MANVQKCAGGTEVANDALNAIVTKASGYPRAGSHVGGGTHVNMPGSWNGSGATPPGWTKQAVSNWVVSALESYVPISDTLATELQKPASLALLSAAEQATLNAAIAARAAVDLELKAALPKMANAAAQAAEVVGK